MKKSVYLQSLLVLCFILGSVAARATVPGVTAAPQNDTVCDGIATWFSVTDTGTLPIAYSWEVSTDGGSTWSPVKDTLSYTGSATDTLWVTANSTLNGYLYKSIATNTDGSDTSSSAILVVKELPAPEAITGGDSICKGSTLTLSDDSTGGVWTSSAPTVATVGSSSGVVSGLMPGFATISYMVTNSCGSTTLTSSVRVDTSVSAQPITGPASLCKGGAPVTLSNVNVSGSWVWSASNGNATVAHSGSVSGVSGGTDVISYTFTNACSVVTSTITVTVDVLLDHGVISGASEVCAGSWITLSETKSGGAWISGNTGIAIVDGAGDVTGVSQGTVAISYYLSNACGASIATDTISVIRPASITKGGDSVGVGKTITLTDSASGGTWVSSDTSIATIDAFSGVVTGVAPGTTMITYTVTNICGTSSNLLTLYVGNPPTILPIYGTSDSAVCVGSTITLLDTTAGGVGTWRSTNDSFATVDGSGIVTGVGIKQNSADTLHNIYIGLDTIVYTFTNAFGSSSVMIPIMVNQKPVVTVSGPAIVALGGNYFFTGTPYFDWMHTPSFYIIPPATTHVGVWSNSNPSMGSFVAYLQNDLYGTYPIQSIASYVVVNPGTDVITYTLTNGCGTSSVKDTISLENTNGVSPLTATTTSGLNVYPNPADGIFNLNLLSATTEETVVTITNIAGEQVDEMKITTNKAYNIKLEQPAGIYMLSAKTSTGNYVAKLTIAK